MWLARAVIALCLVSAACVVWPSDRWLATGLLAYVPPMVRILAAGLALAVLARRPDRNTVWVAPGVLALACGFIDLAVDRGTPDKPRWGAVRDARTLRIAHWNAAYRLDDPRVQGVLARLDADVVALSEARTAPQGTWNLEVRSHHPVDHRATWRGDGVRAAHYVVACEPPLSLVLADVSPWPLRPRAPALRGLAAFIHALDPPPDVVLGDFNTPHHAWSLDALRAGFDDAATLAETGAPFTWPRHLPLMRIDHIFVRRGLSVTRHERGWSTPSDHAFQVVHVRR